MTAPTRTRTKPTRATKTRAATKTAPAPAAQPDKRTQRRGGEQRGRSSAAERAYARRAQRADLVNEQTTRTKGTPAARTRLTLRWPRSRASFVLIVMALLAAGVVTTLWLSTQAIADSYRLEQVRQDNGGLAEQVEQLQRDVSKQQSASSVAERAKELGMVPGGDPARIVVAPDGSKKLVGEPTQATAPAPAPTQESPAAQAPPPQQGGAPQGERQPAGDTPENQGDSSEQPDTGQAEPQP